MGLYDVNNEQFNESDFRPGKPIDPIIRVHGLNQEDDDDSSSSDDGSDDSNLYYQFDSDDEAASEAQSATTKSTLPQRRPLIMDITPTSMQPGAS